MKKIGRRRIERAGATFTVSDVTLQTADFDIASYVRGRLLDTIAHVGTHDRWTPLRPVGEVTIVGPGADMDDWIRGLSTFVARQPRLWAFIGGHPTGKPRGRFRRRRR